MSTISRILYVEDESDIRAVGQIALESVGGFTVEPCASGPEAVEKGPAFAPHMILLDVMMPGMDGITTFAQLRTIENLKETPVIFLTAKIMGVEVEVYKTLGAAGVIAKPFDPMTLSDQVRDIWKELGG